MYERTDRQKIKPTLFGPRVFIELKNISVDGLHRVFKSDGRTYWRKIKNSDLPDDTPPKLTDVYVVIALAFGCGAVTCLILWDWIIA